MLIKQNVHRALFLSSFFETIPIIMKVLWEKLIP